MELQIFSNSEFGEIRTITKDDETYFVGKDVAKALGFTNPRDAIATHVFDEDKGVDTIDTLGGKQSMTIINESGVYALVFGSRLESARRFKHWVTSEVIPSIRKNGGYIAGQETMSDEELMAKALLVANNKIVERDKIIEQKQARIEQMKPKATSHTSILVGDLAKLICQNGVQIGQKRLFVWLRDKGYLIKSGSSYNMPTQRYIEQGLFEIKESNLVNPDGSVRITRTPKVTGKGQVYFVNKFLKGDNSVSI